MTDDRNAQRVQKAVPATIEALRDLGRQVPGGMKAPVDEKVRNKDFSDLLGDLPPAEH